MPEEIVTHSAEETIAWGREFASRVKAPLMILLSGDLGSGKTTLTKGIVSGLGAAAEEDVTSPTFTLLHVYGSENAEQKVFHGDLYRIEKFHDFETRFRRAPWPCAIRCPADSCGWRSDGSNRKDNRESVAKSAG